MFGKDIIFRVASLVMRASHLVLPSRQMVDTFSQAVPTGQRACGMCKTARKCAASRAMK